MQELISFIFTTNLNKVASDAVVSTYLPKHRPQESLMEMHYRGNPEQPSCNSTPLSMDLRSIPFAKGSGSESSIPWYHPTTLIIRHEWPLPSARCAQ